MERYALVAMEPIMEAFRLKRNGDYMDWQYEKVLYRFDGKKFLEYKVFDYDKISAKKIDEIIWKQ